ncbi:PucR family transcriptional regulator [Nonomuraea sp. H19]|uniref:PucR family transcriptional regulator n=1 Tax=Nonomuraea sp. H19 TaxID=3452206 RepID=UPI003F892928
MPPTLQTVVRRMGLRPLAGPASLTGVVRWVAVSELADPTPYLEGDELLLTTGMRLQADQPRPAASEQAVAEYVARLVTRGVAGLGFGVGVSHEEVPAALIKAAGEAGLPLLEVPRETPFIAIGKAVSELLAAEQYEEVTRAFAAQGRLTRAALRPEGVHAVIDRLAQEVGGWAALLDETGEVRHATRGARTAPVTAELTRLRTGRLPEPGSAGRHRPAKGSPPALSESSTRPGTTPGGRTGAQEPGSAEGGGLGDISGGAAGRGGLRVPASLALSGPGEHIVVQPLGGGARPRGFFAVGAEQAFSPVTHTVINAAGSLLTLAMEQGRAHLEAARRVRAAALELLLAGAKEQAHTVLGPLGGRLPNEPLVVLATRADALDALEAHGFAALPDTVGDSAPQQTGGREAGSMAVALAAEAAADEVALESGAPVGLSLPCGYDPAALRGAIDQARRALEAAERAVARRAAGSPGGHGAEASAGTRGAGKGRRRVVRFAELAGQGLLRLLDQPAAEAFSAALLAPLNAYGTRVDLVESLRAYLDSNGHWDAAAQRLGVHRHTLRYRMKRVAELLDRDLDDPGVRAELWLALQAARRR